MWGKKFQESCFLVAFSLSLFSVHFSLLEIFGVLDPVGLRAKEKTHTKKRPENTPVRIPPEEFLMLEFFYTKD